MAGLYESGEDYLESILILQNENGYARSVDVARKLHVTKPSVSRAMGVLEKSGYIKFGRNNELVFTDAGRCKAEEIYSRHVTLTKFLEKIAHISHSQAEENACRIEHDIDSDVSAGIKHWLEENA